MVSGPAEARGGPPCTEIGIIGERSVDTYNNEYTSHRSTMSTQALVGRGMRLRDPHVQEHDV